MMKILFGLIGFVFLGLYFCATFLNTEVSIFSAYGWNVHSDNSLEWKTWSNNAPKGHIPRLERPNSAEVTAQENAEEDDSEAENRLVDKTVDAETDSKSYDSKTSENESPEPEFEEKSSNSENDDSSKSSKTIENSSSTENLEDISSEESTISENDPPKTQKSQEQSAKEKLFKMTFNQENVIVKEGMSMKEIHETLMTRLPKPDYEEVLKMQYPLENYESHKNKERINILFWFAGPRKDERRKPFKERWIGPGNHEYCGDCFITPNRRWKEKADAIVFSNGKLLSWQLSGHYPSEHNYEKPYPPWPDVKKRDEKQWWVFYNRESAVKSINQQPFYFYKKSSEIESAFNGTMNYRRDSDFVKSFGDGSRANADRYFINGTRKGSDESYLQGILEEKKLLEEDVVAAWFVSDCDHTVGAEMRWAYGKRMIDAGIKIHGEGECFNKVTDRKFSRMSTADFNLEHVKFYLAFENAYHCDDYISEKFWRNALTNRAVPIVFGPRIGDVDKVAPPNSFIHAEWFSSPELLVEYVHWLAENNDEYLDYHRWRNIAPEKLAHPIEAKFSARVEDMALCNLCRKIRENREAGIRQYYKSIMKWWSLDASPECQMDTVYPEYLYKIENNKVVEKIDGKS